MKRLDMGRHCTYTGLLVNSLDQRRCFTETPKTTFRFEESFLRLMDRLIEEPPAMLQDLKKGTPKNRAELVRRLVELAAQKQATNKK